MKKVLLAILIFVMFATTASADDWIGYRDIDELFERATNVVRVEVLDNWRYEMINIVTPLPDPIPDDMLVLFEEGILSVEMFNPRYSVYTLHQVKVIESFKGDLQAGDIIDVGQRGGELEDGIKVATPSGRYIFSSGEDLILFMRVSASDGMRYENLLGPWWYAIYRYPSLESVDERNRNRFTLTMNDLYYRFTTADALIILQAAAGLIELNEWQIVRFEIDGEPTTADALRILRLVAGL
jgi:hypothetical protein